MSIIDQFNSSIDTFLYIRLNANNYCIISFDNINLCFTVTNICLQYICVALCYESLVFWKTQFATVKSMTDISKA